MVTLVKKGSVPQHLPPKFPLHSPQVLTCREVERLDTFPSLEFTSATCICRSLNSRSGISHLPHCTQNGPVHCPALLLFMQIRLDLDKLGEGKCRCFFGALIALTEMWHDSLLFVCLWWWCGGGGRRRAEPLRNQVSESFHKGRDKMQTDDMRRHSECMVLGFYLHHVRMITPPPNSCPHEGQENDFKIINLAVCAD